MQVTITAQQVTNQNVALIQTVNSNKSVLHSKKAALLSDPTNSPHSFVFLAFLTQLQFLVLTQACFFPSPCLPPALLSKVFLISLSASNPQLPHMLTSKAAFFQLAGARGGRPV